MNGLGSLSNLLLLGRGSLALLSTEFRLVGRGKVHLVRVDDLGLLFKIKGLLVVLDLSLRKLAVVVLTVVTEKRFGVRVPHEPISATDSSRSLITSWQILD